MADFNELVINIKTHLFNLPANRPKPTCQEIDVIFRKIMVELKKDAVPLIRY